MNDDEDDHIFVTKFLHEDDQEGRKKTTEDRMKRKKDRFFGEITKEGNSSLKGAGMT